VALPNNSKKWLKTCCAFATNATWPSGYLSCTHFNHFQKNSEAKGNWHSTISMVPYIPILTNIFQNSIIHFNVNVYFCVFLVCIVKFQIFVIKFYFKKWRWWVWAAPSPVLLSVMTGDACTFDMQNQILLTNLLIYLIFAFLYLQTQLYIEK